MRKDLTEELSIEDYKLDLENRIRNLLWTVSGRRDQTGRFCQIF